MPLTATTLHEAADRLIAAADAPRQCNPVRDILGDNDIAAAYSVQQLLTQDPLARTRLAHRRPQDRPDVPRATSSSRSAAAAWSVARKT